MIRATASTGTIALFVLMFGTACSGSDSETGTPGGGSGAVAGAGGQNTGQKTGGENAGGQKSNTGGELSNNPFAGSGTVPPKK